MTTETDNRPEVVLHIGTMKSGTSYIQEILRRNKRLLNDDGVLAPSNMVPAVADVLGRRGVTKSKPIQGTWGRFLHLVEAWDGRAVLASQEFLSGATADEARAVIDTLPTGKVRVVITNRDLLRVIPSHWQTVIKNGGTWQFAEYMRLLLDEDTKDGAEHRYQRGFWRHHDIANIVENWAGAVGPENVLLVTVPRTGAPSELLWQRFAKAIGVDADKYDHQASAKSNISLSYAETEMLRELNLRVRKPLGPLEYRLIVNKYLANQLLRKPPDTGREPDRPTLGERSHAKVHQRAEQMLDALTATKVGVIGDLEELRVSPYQGESGTEDSTGPRQPIPDSVPEALAKLVLRIARLERDLEGFRSGEPASEPSESPRGGGRRGGGNRAGGKGGRRGARQGARRAAKRAAAAEGEIDGDDYDIFDPIPFEGGEHGGESDDER